MLVGQGRAGKTALANNLAGRWMEETASTIGAEQMDLRLLYGDRFQASSLKVTSASEGEVVAVEREKGDIAIASPIKLHDVKLDEVDLHYRKLQEVDTASSYKLLLVDFGGQSIFNVLHGFFMSRYGVYVVVFDMELFLSGDAAGRESCRKELKFWLNSITMHTCGSTAGRGKTATVAIVGTRGDKVMKEEDHEKISSQLKDMFGEMKVWESLM
eukprot:gene14488-biopygen3313